MKWKLWPWFRAGSVPRSTKPRPSSGKTAWLSKAWVAGAVRPALPPSSSADTVTNMGIVLVTGASTGIGQATAVHFARRGHQVIAGVRDVASATELRAIVDAQRLPISVEPLDVTDDASVTDGVARVLARTGVIDVLVNNAGVSMSSALELAPMEEARQIFEVNYFGVIRMLRAVVPGMRVRGRGTIINVGSISGVVPFPALGHYSASKAALAFATETLAQEVYRFGIRVALVEPGVTTTPMFTRRKRLRPIDPKSPYIEDLSDLYNYFKEWLNEGLSPDDVAQVIERAVTLPVHKFRFQVGNDMLSTVRSRRAVSDEVWIRAPRHVRDARAARTGGPRAVPRRRSRDPV